MADTNYRSKAWKLKERKNSLLFRSPDEWNQLYFVLQHNILPNGTKNYCFVMFRTEEEYTSNSKRPKHAYALDNALVKKDQIDKDVEWSLQSNSETRLVLQTTKETLFLYFETCRIRDKWYETLCSIGVKSSTPATSPASFNEVAPPTATRKAYTDNAQLQRTKYKEFPTGALQSSLPDERPTVLTTSRPPPATSRPPPSTQGVPPPVKDTPRPTSVSATAHKMMPSVPTGVPLPPPRKESAVPKTQLDSSDDDESELQSQGYVNDSVLQGIRATSIAGVKGKYVNQQTIDTEDKAKLEKANSLTGTSTKGYVNAETIATHEKSGTRAMSTGTLSPSLGNYVNMPAVKKEPAGQANYENVDVKINPNKAKASGQAGRASPMAAPVGGPAAARVSAGTPGGGVLGQADGHGYENDNRNRCSNPSCSTEGSSMLVCSGCMTTQYCNEQCQKRDWNRHKRNCAGAPAAGS